MQLHVVQKLKANHATHTGQHMNISRNISQCSIKTRLVVFKFSALASLASDV
jgi:hypothetical protein